MRTNLYEFILKYNNWMAYLFLFLFVSPYFILRESAYIPLYDILEYIPVYKIVGENIYYLLAPNDYIIPNMMSGLPRVSYPSEMNIQVWLFYFFPPFYAYVINVIFIHLIAFYGAKKFLQQQLFTSTYFQKYISTLNSDEKNFLINFSALYFALIPFWTLGGISIAGIPLLLHSFLNLFQKAKWIDYLVIVLFPFYSFFIFSNIFLIPALFIIFIIQSYWSQKVQWRFLLFLILFAILSIITEYRIILSSIHHFEHHREFNIPSFHSYYDFVSSFFEKLINNTDFYFYPYIDAPSKHYPFLFFFVLFSVFLSLIMQEKKIFKVLSLLFLLTLILGFSYPLSGHIKFLLQKLMPAALTPLLKGFTMRIFVLNPMVWYVLLSISTVYVFQFNSFSKKVVLFFLLLFNIYMLITSGKSLNVLTSRLLESPFANNIKNKGHSLSFRSYFDTALFNKIDMYIQHELHLNKNQYRVAALTDRQVSYPLFSPSVLLYNNFYTIDGYCVYYPKKYRHLFYQIIEKETNKKNGFYTDEKSLGNRVYIYSADTLKNGDIKSLDLNYNLLKQLNCKFLFSRKKILQPDSHLVYINNFEGEYWKINLYEIK